MPNEEELRSAKLWCDEARTLLKVAKYSKEGQKDLSQRIDKIFAKLKALDKGVKSGKYGLTSEELDGYVQRFLAMSASLNTAARKNDLVEVDRQSQRLSELKKELAVHLATSKRGKEKAQKQLADRAEANVEINAYVTARDTAIDRVAGLRVHEQADAIEADLDLIESSRLDVAKALADQKNYTDAMKLLAGVEGDCVLAEGFANRCAAYALERAKIGPRLVLCRKHGQAAAADAELRRADEKVLAATAFAHPSRRDYNGAIAALGDAWELSVEALKISERCQSFVDARPAAVKSITDVSLHKQANMVQAELEALRDKLRRADALAEVATRSYEDAIGLLNEIKSEALLAATLADQCQVYLDDKVRVEDAITECGRHAQADAVEAELQRAAEQLAEAADLALPTVRNFTGAQSSVGTARLSVVEAKRIADLCQQAADARKPAAELLSVLGTQRKRFDAVREALETLEPRLDRADALAAKDKRQYEAAKAAYEQIALDAGLVKGAADKVTWDQSQERAAKALLEGLQAGSSERTRLEAMWALAHEQAESGDHAKALQTLGKVRALALEAQKSQAQTPTGKSVTERVGEVDADIQTSVALSEVQNFVNNELQAAIALGVAFGDKAPAAWKIETDRIALTLTLERDAGPVAIEAALAQAKLDLAKHEAAVRKLTSERDAWQARWQVWETQKRSLTAHAGSTNPRLATQFSAVEVACNLCKVQAQGLLFTDALEALELQLTAMEKLFKLADAAANYNAVQVSRASALLALPVAQPTPEGTAARLVAQGFLDAAGVQATAGEFVEAMKELAKIPDQLDKVAWTNVAAAGYAAFVSGWKPWYDHWLTLDAKYKDHIAAELVHMGKVVTDSALAATGGDVLKADAITSGGGQLFTTVYGSLLPAITLYVDQRAIFDAKFTQVENHAGRPGIEGFYDRLKAERDFADACVHKREFAAAQKVLLAIEPLITPQLDLAARYVTYLVKKTDTKNKIEVIRVADSTGVATAELAEAAQYLTLADQHQAAAATEVAIGKFADAETALTAALARANVGKAIIEKAKALQNMKPPSGGDASAVQARIDAFPGMKSHVKLQAGDTTFDALLDSADAPVQQAVTALTGDAPQLDVAGAALDTADGILADALQKIGRKPAYDSQLAAAELAAQTTLPGLNVVPNKCLDAEIQAIEGLITAAKDLAKSPAFDFVGAGPKLAEALIKAGQAKEKHAVFLSLAADRLIIKNLITHLETGFVPPLAAERDRLKKVQTDIDKQLAALNFAAARKLAADGKALKTPFEKLCTDYTAITSRRTTVYADADTKIVGKSMCKIEEDELKVQKVQVDKLIDTDHAFTAARMLLTRIGHLAFFAVEEVKRHKEYTDLLTPLNDRLPAIKLASNDGVKQRIAEAVAAFKRANDFAAGREYEQAKLELKPLKDLLDAIDRDTPLYAAYEVSYNTATTRFLAATNHVKLDVVLPLLATIKVKYKQCKALADRGEFVAAKKLADEIPGNCDAAVLAADSYTQFETLGAGGLPPEAAALEEAAKRVEQKITDVRKDAPPAEQLPGKIVEALDKVNSARALFATDPQAAADLIREASAAAAAAEVHRLQWEQIRLEIAAALKLVDDFTGGAHAAKAFVAERMANTRAEMEGARQLMVSRGSEAASNSLTSATATFHDNVALADRRDAYVKERKKLEPDGGDSVLTQLENSPHRYAGSDDIDVLRAKLAEAAKQADAAQPDFAKAMAALKEADAAAAAARLAIGMIANVAPPSPDDIAKVLGAPKGDEKLDAMVLRLEPSARRAVLQAAFKVRFGCQLDIYKDTTLDVTDNNLGADVQRMYKNMAKLPPKHVLKNDSLLVVQERRDATGTAGPGGSSDFAPWFKTMTMRDGPAATSAGRDLGAAYSLGDAVPENCKPKDGPPVQHVDWNTLHEAGHAVESKYGFMLKHQGELAYGGWTFYGKDVRRIAEKLVTEFEYDLTYTTELLAGVADPALPAPIDGVSYEEWELRRQRLKLWVENAQCAKNPWETNSIAMTLKLKSGEIIHDAYGGEWYGYMASERSKGITGYQFRSPVEWFSEIYAAFFSDKLKPSHPAHGWLESLKTAEVG